MLKIKVTLISLISILSLSVFAQGFLPEYTIMYFGSGFNNLDQFIQQDVNQMEMLGSTRKIQVVAQLASSQARTVRRYFITKDSNASQITSPVLQDIGVVDMGNWKVLTEFILWGMKNYPSKRYFVIIGGHGNGWRETSQNRAANNPIRGISPDDLSGNIISTTQLAMAFETVRRQTGKQIDIFGADACLMASVEVGTQLSNGVKVMVASQENEPGEGWVYQELLMRINRESDQSPRNIGRLAAKSYIEGYRRRSSGYYRNEEVTISASDLSETVKFAAKFGKLTKIIATSKNLADYNKALNASRRFGGDDAFADVGDLLANLTKVPMDEVSKRIVKELQNDYESKVVIRDHSSASHAFSTGLHIWAPSSSDDVKRFLPAYSQLFFHKVNGWGNLFVSR